MKRIYLMCGVPGSGKSTWIRMKFKELEENEGVKCAIVSRDKIRFSFLQKEDEYFAKESDVFDMFVKTINYGLEQDNVNVIFVDATHLNPPSRNKVLRRLNLNGVEVIPVAFDLPLETCMTNNAKREGRERVPDSAMQSMFNSYKLPTKEENTVFTDVIYISY